MNEQLLIAGFSIWTRTEKAGDRDVIEEVIQGDCYKLKELSTSGYKPSLILDLGAHIGCFSLLANKYFPDVPIIAFEPNERSFELLRLNTAGKNISCINKAVRYGDATLLYVDSDIATGGGFVTSRPNPPLQADGYTYYVLDNDVKAASLEGVLQPNTLLKMDIEGSEYNIFEGIGTESSCVTHLCGEYHSRFSPDSDTWGAFEKLAKKAFPHLTFTPRLVASCEIFWGK